MPRFSKFEIKLIKEAAIFIAADKRTKRIMIEGCGDPDPAAEQIKIDSVDMYPEEHTGHVGRMMDYGHKKSDSHEGRMTKAKLFRLAQMAQRLHDKMVDEDDLPEWVQDKVTTAEDRLKSAHDYITYKIHRLEENRNQFKDNKMKVTKAQLRQIVKEEKSKLINEMRGFRDPKTGEDLFLKLNGIVDMLLDMGMDTLELANELRGLADDVEESGPIPNYR